MLRSKGINSNIPSSVLPLVVMVLGIFDESCLLTGVGFKDEMGDV